MDIFREIADLKIQQTTIRLKMNTGKCDSFAQNLEFTNKAIENKLSTTMIQLQSYNTMLGGSNKNPLDMVLQKLQKIMSEKQSLLGNFHQTTPSQTSHCDFNDMVESIMAEVRSGRFSGGDSHDHSVGPCFRQGMITHSVGVD